MEPKVIEKLIAGSKESIMRAAARIILENMEPDESEAGAVAAINDLADTTGMGKSLTAALVMHSFVEAFIGASMKQFSIEASQMGRGQKVGSC